MNSIRPTVASLAADQAELRSDLAGLRGDIQALIASLRPEAPAKEVATTTSSKARKPGTPGTTAKRIPSKGDAKPARGSAKAKVMTKANRVTFVNANAWAKGLSCLDIAIAVTVFDQDAKGWVMHDYLVEKASRATAAAKKAVKAAL